MRSDSKEYVVLPIAPTPVGATVEVGFAATPYGVPPNWFAAVVDPTNATQWVLLVDPAGASALTAWKNKDVYLIIRILNVSPEIPIVYAGPLWVR